MKRTVLFAAALAALAAPVAAAPSQLEAQVGRYVENTEGLTVGQLAQVKFVIEDDTNEADKARRIEAIVN